MLGTKMGVPQLGPSKFKLFNHSSKTHETFRIGNSEGKIKYDRVWRYRNGPPN